jgi:hypothetical protein
MGIFESYIIKLCNAFSNPKDKERAVSFIMANYNSQTQTYEFANGVSVNKAFMYELIENPEYYKTNFMKNSKIPRPDETTYYQNQHYTQLWGLVVESLQKNIFRIEPPNHITLYDHMDRLNGDLKLYGWIGTKNWEGTKDDGCSILELKPLNDEK